MGIIDEAASLGLITLLDRLGFGASKRVGFFLPSVNIEQVKILLGHFSVKQGWRLIKEENHEGALIIIFQVGQWGLSISGSQRVYLALNQEQTGVRGAATSKSTMGQLVDWGSNQKNLDNLVVFLEQAISQPNRLGNLLSQPASFTPAKSTINPKFFWILGLMFLGFFILRIILYIITVNNLNRTLENDIYNRRAVPEVVVPTSNPTPGKVIITFDWNIPKEEMKSLLVDFGTTSCENKWENEWWSFLCVVPVGREKEIMNLAKSSPKVERVSRWYGN